MTVLIAHIFSSIAHAVNVYRLMIVC